MTDVLISIPQAMKILRCSRWIIDQLIKDGVLNARRNGQVRLSLRQVKDLAERHVGELDTYEVAAALGVSERMVQLWAEQGKITDRRFELPGGKKLGHYRFKKIDIEKLSSCDLVALVAIFLPYGLILVQL